MNVRISAAVAATLAVLIQSGAAVATDRTAIVNGQEVRVAGTAVALSSAQVQRINQLKRELERQVPAARQPLRFEGGANDLTAIPDARDVGQGDCKTYSVAMRNMIAAELGLPLDALLLAGALTERGQPHIVLLIQTEDGALAYDSRMERVLRVSELTRIGYRWLFRESAAGGIPIVFDGSDLLHDPSQSHLRAQARHLRR